MAYLPRRWSNLAVYRDKLALDDKARRSASAALARPQAPTPGFPTYGAAFFYRQALRDRAEFAETRDALSAEGIATFADRFPVKGGGDDALKLRFTALEYALALDANLAQSGRLDGAARKALQDASNRIALQLSQTEDSWRAEVYPTVLARLATPDASDEATRATDAAFLVESLEKSYARGSFDRDAAIWSRAAATVSALKRANQTDAARRAQAILEKASARDYALLLNADAEASYVSFEDFKASVQTAEAQIPRQVRNVADVDKAREKLGAAFAARMAIELTGAFATEDRDELERARRSLEYWTTFAEKISFGRSVLGTFVELRRADLTGAGAVSEATRRAFGDLEAKIYQSLDLALDSDRRLNEAFAEKLDARASAAPNLATSDVFTYLARNDQVAFNLAAYLVDKTLYGSERAESIVESGKLLETALAVLFALDALDAGGQKAIAFERVERFESYLAKLESETDVRTFKRYAEKIIETKSYVKALLQEDVEPDAADVLRERALANLSDARVGVPSENKPLLVALALLAKYEHKNLEALEYLDQVQCVGLAETKARELALLEAFPDDEDEKIVERRKSAVAFLVGGRLDENEGARLLKALLLAKEDAEADKIRKRLQKFATSQTIITELIEALNEKAKRRESLDDAPREVVPLQNVLSPSAINESIGAIAAEGSTNIYPALTKATEDLFRANAKFKHVILLTDGQSVPGDYEKTLRRAAAGNITVSTVGIGGDADKFLLEKLAAEGSGRFYYCEDVSSTPQIFARETKLADRSNFNETPFLALEEPGAATILSGVSLEYAPPLLGNVVVRAKPTSETVLSTESGDPLLSYWRYGLGKTAAFTSDVDGRWSAEWLDWDEFPQFWAQTIRFLARSVNSDRAEAQVALDETRARVTLDARDRNEDYLNGAETTVSVVDGRGRKREVEANQKAPGLYEATFPVKLGEKYRAFANAMKNGESIAAVDRVFAVDQGRESDVAPPNEALLREIAKRTGGLYDPTPQELRAAFGDARARRGVPLRFFALALALLVYVVDVYLRRGVFMK